MYHRAADSWSIAVPVVTVVVVVVIPVVRVLLLISSVLLLCSCSHSSHGWTTPSPLPLVVLQPQRLRPTFHPSDVSQEDSRMSRSDHHHHHPITTFSNIVFTPRRTVIHTVVVAMLTTTLVGGTGPTMATTIQDATPSSSSSSSPVQVRLTGDTLKLFNEGQTYERQGNILAAQRLYEKVTRIAPRYIYGWSQLGNTQVILTTSGDLTNAEQSYNTAIDLCQESIRDQQQERPDGNTFGVKRCSDLYVLLLNRGCLRLNTGQYSLALLDLQQAQALRGQPDAIISQNLARAYEYNGQYERADAEYNLAISMSNSNEVSPFWLRSALVKYQLGAIQSGFDLLKRVSNRFPDAPEVRAAYAVFLLERNPDRTMTMEVQQMFLDIPIRQRLKFGNRDYMTKTICWPPAMMERLNTIIKAVGDDQRSV